MLTKKRICLLALAILASGCASPLGTSPETPTRTPNVPRTTVVLSPADIPAEIPLYPGAVEVEAPFGQITSYTVGDVDVHTVGEFYAEHLQRLGWDQITDSGTNIDGKSTKYMLFEKSGIMVQIDVFPNEGVTLIWLRAYNL